MYRQYYGLREQPFSISPDPRFLYLSEAHREGLSHLAYGIQARRGFVVVTGEVGTGKTTLIHALLADIPQEVRVAFLSNPTLTREEFFFLLAEAYQLGAVEHKARFLSRFTEFLEEANRADENVVLIVDEAHCLSRELLEEIRLLSNLETPHHKLLNIILVGQPELDAVLENPHLRPLRQRITLRYQLVPLSLEETVYYIQVRLLKAGAQDFGVFTEAALRAIYHHSKGTPRLINILADHALLTGFVKEVPRIDEEVIEECALELSPPGERRRSGGPGRVPRKREWNSWALRVAFIVVFLTMGILFLWWGSVSGNDVWWCNGREGPGIENGAGSVVTEAGTKRVFLPGTQVLPGATLSFPCVIENDVHPRVSPRGEAIVAAYGKDHEGP